MPTADNQQVPRINHRCIAITRLLRRANGLNDPGLRSGGACPLLPPLTFDLDESGRSVRLLVSTLPDNLAFPSSRCQRAIVSDASIARLGLVLDRRLFLAGSLVLPGRQNVVVPVPEIWTWLAPKIHYASPVVRDTATATEDLWSLFVVQCVLMVHWLNLDTLRHTGAGFGALCQ